VSLQQREYELRVNKVEGISSHWLNFGKVVMQHLS